jgi:hypothetical protein
VPNNDELNFEDGITLSFWINISEFYSREQYPISHGNWQTRWKISIGDQKLRLTINGTNGVIDLDMETILETNTWYHVVAIYNGWGCEIYLDGVIDAFKAFDGKINPTTYDLIFGQSLPGQSGYDFNGILDNVKLFDYGISYEKVLEIYQAEISFVAENHPKINFNIYPIPAKKRLFITVNPIAYQNIEVSCYSLDGRIVFRDIIKNKTDQIAKIEKDVSHLNSGIYYIVLQSTNFIQAKKAVILH